MKKQEVFVAAQKMQTAALSWPAWLTPLYKGYGKFQHQACNDVFISAAGAFGAAPVAASPPGKPGHQDYSHGCAGNPAWCGDLGE